MDSESAERIVESERAWLRPVQTGDLDLLAGWFGSPEFVEHWGGTPLKREEVAEKYLGRGRPGVEPLVVQGADGPLGYAQYWNDEEGGSGGIDLVLTPEAQGRGLGSEVGRALSDYLLDELGWKAVSVDPATDNPRAIAAWRKAGFEEQETRGNSVLMTRLKAGREGDR